ncbi:gluconokinase [Sphingomonas morindae]|uniref:Gluconokinase n=1 Tax=Sphingomonas morindae TaxID=1541170 RepID=A0ABY4XCF1_9SPHN|nr:gluconokinase [Sphingomonas morindae]USI74565.1 gluconokinase [Sphingomonas morindae]
MGVSGSGKSTLGAALAARLACPFLEGDSFHAPEAVAKMRGGEPLTDEDRWPWLDRLGAALDQAVRAEGLAIAACSALKRAYRTRLEAAIAAPVAFLLLDVARDELAARLERRTDHYMPKSLLDSQLATLERPDADEPALVLDSTRPPEALAARAVEWLAGAAVR